MRLSAGREKKGLATLPKVKGMEQIGLAGLNKPVDTRGKVAKIAKVGHDTVAKAKRDDK